jgi:hypothetical protein
LFRLLPIILGLLYCIPARAQQGYTQQLEILELIYQGKYKESQNLLESFSFNDPHEKAVLEIFLLRWKHIPVALSPVSKEYLGKLLSLEQALNERALEKETAYYKICTYLFLAECHAAKNNMWEAARAVQRAYPSVLTCFDDSLTSDECTFVKGLYLYYADLYQDNHFTGKLMIPFIKNGDREAGLKFLSAASFSKSRAGTEAAIYKAHILLHFEKKPKEALAVSETLAMRYPDNLKLLELYAECLLACGQYGKAQPVIERLRHTPDKFFHCAAQLFEGILQEEVFNNIAKAKEHYRQSLKDGEAYGSMLQAYKKQAEKRLIDLP